MNRRGAKSTNRIVFEPKVPVSQPAAPEPEPTSLPNAAAAEAAPSKELRGAYAPLSFASAKKFNPHGGNFILNIPPFLCDAVLVVFRDGTMALRKDGVLYDCDASFIGDGITVEMGSKATKLGDAKYIVTSFGSSEDS
ncbi:hypothetical protein PAPHI01_0494 [Pancytospora philotis]|nr:hypothetical protein PAPHI01_0494 [Pancytospora philotis]